MAVNAFKLGCIVLNADLNTLSSQSGVIALNDDFLDIFYDGFGSSIFIYSYV